MGYRETNDWSTLQPDDCLNKHYLMSAAPIVDGSKNNFGCRLTLNKADT